MKKKCYAFLCYFSFSLCSLNAETTEVVLSNSMKCTKEELMRFYPEQLVQSTLIKANIPKDQAEEISKELAQKDKELAKIVEKKSSEIDSNPFKNASQRELAVKIYRETLLEVFGKVLKEHGIQDEAKIQQLLDELQDARSKLFIECIRKQPSTEP